MMDIVLLVSLTLKALSEILAKNENFAKTVISLFLMCFKHKIAICVQFRRKSLIFEEIREFSNFKVLTMKNGPKFDDVIGAHVRGPKFENLFFILWNKF